MIFKNFDQWLTVICQYSNKICNDIWIILLFFHEINHFWVLLKVTRTFTVGIKDLNTKNILKTITLNENFSKLADFTLILSVLFIPSINFIFIHQILGFEVVWRLEEIIYLENVFQNLQRKGNRVMQLVWFGTQHWEGCVVKSFQKQYLNLNQTFQFCFNFFFEHFNINFVIDFA